MINIYPRAARLLVSAGGGFDQDKEGSNPFIFGSKGFNTSIDNKSQINVSFKNLESRLEQLISLAHFQNDSLKELIERTVPNPSEESLQSLYSKVLEEIKKLNQKPASDKDKDQLVSALEKFLPNFEKSLEGLQEQSKQTEQLVLKSVKRPPPKKTVQQFREELTNEALAFRSNPSLWAQLGRLTAKRLGVENYYDIFSKLPSLKEKSSYGLVSLLQTTAQQFGVDDYFDLIVEYVTKQRDVSANLEDSTEALSDATDEIISASKELNKAAKYMEQQSQLSLLQKETERQEEFRKRRLQEAEQGDVTIINNILNGDGEGNKKENLLDSIFGYFGLGGSAAFKGGGSGGSLFEGAAAGFLAGSLKRRITSLAKGAVSGIKSGGSWLFGNVSKIVPNNKYKALIGLGLAASGLTAYALSRDNNEDQEDSDKSDTSLQPQLPTSQSGNLQSGVPLDNISAGNTASDNSSSIEGLGIGSALALGATALLANRAGVSALAAGAKIASKFVNKNTLSGLKDVAKDSLNIVSKVSVSGKVRPVTSAVRSAGRGLSKLLGPLALVLSSYSTWQTLQDLYGLHQMGVITEEEFRQEFSKEIGKLVGGVGGAALLSKLGAVGGGLLGSAVPGLGTAIGAGAGGVIGGVTGFFVGESVGEKVGDQIYESFIKGSNKSELQSNQSSIPNTEAIASMARTAPAAVPNVAPNEVSKGDEDTGIGTSFSNRSDTINLEQPFIPVIPSVGSKPFTPSIAITPSPKSSITPVPLSSLISSQAKESALAPITPSVTLGLTPLSQVPIDRLPLTMGSNSGARVSNSNTVDLTKELTLNFKSVIISNASAQILGEALGKALVKSNDFLNAFTKGAMLTGFIGGGRNLGQPTVYGGGEPRGGAPYKGTEKPFIQDKPSSVRNLLDTINRQDMDVQLNKLSTFQLPDFVRNIRVKDSKGQTRTLSELGVNTYSDLRTKGGQAFAGGYNDPATLYATSLIANELGDNFDRVTAQNDLYHQRYVPTSGHVKGNKVDFTVKGLDLRIAHQRIAETMARYGLVEGKDFNIISTPHGTGKHIDFKLTPSGQSVFSQIMMAENLQDLGLLREGNLVSDKSFLDTKPQLGGLAFGERNNSVTSASLVSNDVMANSVSSIDRFVSVSSGKTGIDNLSPISDAVNHMMASFMRDKATPQPSTQPVVINAGSGQLQNNQPDGPRLGNMNEFNPLLAMINNGIWAG